jgi:2-polyprenyl-6-methoxyphenol hydroxylase-like FAD-dependent oxidoreductase
LGIKDQSGKDHLAPDYDGDLKLYINRGKVQLSMYEHASTWGAMFVFGARISKLFEDEKSAGVIIEGQKQTARFVIGAYGVHSKSRSFVTVVREKP